MENTGSTLFKDDSPRWYIGMGERWIGPLTASDVYEKVVAQEISWAHYVWRDGQSEWTRICDTAEFKVAVPAQPKAKPPAPPKSPAPPSPPVAARSWFTYHNNTQSGPFSEEEISDSIRTGKVGTGSFLWKDGMKGWEKIEKVDTFQNLLPKAAAAPTTKDQRAAPRRPLVAKMIMATTEPSREAVNVAVCRDISIGGMQVLTDHLPGQVGAKIKMNVSPAQVETDAPIQPFVATGVIVRILEDGRGFSFRFDQLSPDARKSIEEYIQVTG